MSFHSEAPSTHRAIGVGVFSLTHLTPGPQDPPLRLTPDPQKSPFLTPRDGFLPALGAVHLISSGCEQPGDHGRC